MYHHVSSCIIWLADHHSQKMELWVHPCLHHSSIHPKYYIYSMIYKNWSYLSHNVISHHISPIFRFFPASIAWSKHQSHKSNWIRWPTRRFDHAPRYWSVESPSVFHRTKSGPAIWVSPSTRWNTSSKSSKQALSMWKYHEISWNTSGLENTHNFWSHRSCASCFSACSWCL